MAWTERIREAAYTSPEGTRTVFQFENVRKSFDKRTTAFEFPDADGTYVQDLGRSGRKYPIRAIFSGGNCDLEADAFEETLFQRGVGKLEHPMYGPADVVPFGAVSRRDDLKTAANQAIVEVTFWETIRLVYPTVQSDPGSQVLAAVEEYNAAAATEFEQVTDLDSAVERTTFENSYQALLDRTATRLEAIADVQDDVRRQFEAIRDSIDRGIDLLIAEPLNLAFQTTLMIQSPARAAAAIEARLSAYADLARALISGDGAVVEPGFDSSQSNAFHATDLFVSTDLTGSIVSVVNNEFVTKTDALAAADSILTLFDEVVVWRDANYESLQEVDTGGAYQKLQDAVAITAGFLVEISFSLKQERTITLDRKRTIVDLAAEIYGEIDPQLDFLINSNNLSGSEILELPVGREIVYYV